MKALGNGYPINVILQRMDYENATEHLSVALWSDRIGPTAAIKTLDEMEKLNLENNHIYGKKYNF